jgi:hypothetical protein
MIFERCSDGVPRMWKRGWPKQEEWTTKEVLFFCL